MVAGHDGVPYQACAAEDRRDAPEPFAGPSGGPAGASEASVTIKVTRGLRRLIREFPDQIYLQVRQADDPEAAAVGLRNSLAELERLGQHHLSWDGQALTPNNVGGVGVVPDGPFTSLDAKSVPAEELARIPDIVTRHLHEAGVTKAVLSEPTISGALDELEHTPRAVVLRVYMALRPDSMFLPEEPPRWWVERAASWLVESSGAEVLHARAGVPQFPLLAADLDGFVAAFPQRTEGVVVGGDLAGRAWGVHFSIANMALAFGGPAASDDELLAVAETFIDMARRVAPEAVHAFVDFQDRFGVFSVQAHRTPWAVEANRESGDIVSGLPHLLCYDGFPYQVLGPGHLSRLAAAAPDGRLPDALRPLPGGRAELAVGQLSEWLPGRDRGGVAGKTRELLEACLLTKGESKPFLDTRWAEVQAAQAAAGGAGSEPD